MSVIELIEQAGNLVLSLDPETAQLLENFEGKTFCIEIQEPNYTVYLSPCEDGFALDSHTGQTPDVTLSGSLWSFIKLAREGNDSDVFHTGRIRMQGDAELGQAFQHVMMQLDIDWEELTSKVVGDFASRQIHTVVSEINSWFAQSKRQFNQNLGEVLQEEWRKVPSQVEVERFTDNIEQLRSDLERIEARIKSLLGTKQA